MLRKIFKEREETLLALYQNYYTEGLALLKIAGLRGSDKQLVRDEYFDLLAEVFGRAYVRLNSDYKAMRKNESKAFSHKYYEKEFSDTLQSDMEESTAQFAKYIFSNSDSYYFKRAIAMFYRYLPEKWR